MDEVSFLPEQPPDEPPAGSSAELLWRVAVRLFRDHSTPREAVVPIEPCRCQRCGQPWPCSGRRLALLGLRVAARPRKASIRTHAGDGHTRASDGPFGAPSGTPPG